MRGIDVAIFNFNKRTLQNKLLVKFYRVGKKSPINWIFPLTREKCIIYQVTEKYTAANVKHGVLCTVCRY